jgi:hypothetical protein
MENLVQKTGDEMSGDLDMNGNDLVDATISGSQTKMTAGQIVGVPLRGAVDDSSNQIVVPSDGSRATAGGEDILTEGDDLFGGALSPFPTGVILLWYGSALNIPAGWVLCDGTSGTPDLREKFVRGAGGSVALDSTGGSSSATTSSSGDHVHTVGDTTLTEDQMPTHNHRFWYGGSGNDGGGLVDNYGSIASASPAYFDTVQGGAGVGNKLIEDAGGSDPHTHSLTSGGAHQHTVATLPPYVGIYYIMKT